MLKLIEAAAAIGFRTSGKKRHIGSAGRVNGAGDKNRHEIVAQKELRIPKMRGRKPSRDLIDKAVEKILDPACFQRNQPRQRKKQQDPTGAARQRRKPMNIGAGQPYRPEQPEPRPHHQQTGDRDSPPPEAATENQGAENDIIPYLITKRPVRNIGESVFRKKPEISRESQEQRQIFPNGRILIEWVYRSRIIQNQKIVRHPCQGEGRQRHRINPAGAVEYILARSAVPFGGP